jgi:hypothetical protein
MSLKYVVVLLLYVLQYKILLYYAVQDTLN